MSMNGHAKRTIQTLMALDFRLDDDASTSGHRVYFHPNDPTRRVKVFSGMSEIAAKKARNLASEIAGLSSAGERIPTSIGENARIRRQSEKAKRQAEAERAERARTPFQRLADAKAAAEKRRREAAEAAAEAYRHDRDIRNLMMPGGAR